MFNMRSRAWMLVACVLFGCLFIPARAWCDAGPRPLMDAGELEVALGKLRVLGSVLYVGAHPDDENTAMLAYFAKGRRLRTGYLSLTRGDGGQNLIGDESGTRLGVIRTQELLAARELDGAEQFFTRALDFGYSKSTDETIEIWGGDEILRDVVWVIRRFRPDVIVTRFTPELGGHGHHTASAALAERAFDAAADPRRFPEQLKQVRPWQVKRMFWNAFRIDPAARGAEEPKLLELDLGEYNPLLGRSYTEIAAAGRSQHKSQGFGSSARRGSQVNYLLPTKGDPAERDPFEGVALDWSRVAGGERVDAILERAEQRFDAKRPADILPDLIEAHAMLMTLGDDPWVEIKRRDLIEVIRSCSGLWTEAIASVPTTHPGSTLEVEAMIVNRSDATLVLERIELPFGAAAMEVGKEGAGKDAVVVRDRELKSNQAIAAKSELRLPANVAETQPFWLQQPPTKGRFAIEDLDAIGRAENRPPLVARFVVRAGGQRIVFESPIVYRWTDPVAGERFRPLEILPALAARFDREVYLFADGMPRDVEVIVSGEAGASGTVRLNLPRGWGATPATVPFKLDDGAAMRVGFKVLPPPGALLPVRADMAAQVVSNGRTYTRSIERIEHDHIPVQQLLPPARATLVRADVRHHGESIGYAMGSGDLVPDALREMGYRVSLLSDEEIATRDLSGFDAVVVGVRAYNTRPKLAALQLRLLDYVSDGGTLVIQYNSWRGFDVALGPYPLTLSRDRVTVEEAPMTLLHPEHPLLTTPNRINQDDFVGWVQERGLSFANPYDEHYETVLATNDPGEEPQAGGLLYARHGDGVFIYTGLAWFRQLPAGVPGAYRLFANLVSGGK